MIYVSHVGALPFVSFTQVTLGRDWRKAAGPEFRKEAADARENVAPFSACSHRRHLHALVDYAIKLGSGNRVQACELLHEA